MDQTSKHLERIELAPATLLAPVPAVMVSCASPGAKPNIITIAWTGVVNSVPPMLSIAVREDRWSHKILKASGEFVVNLVSDDLVDACNFCGSKSGAEVDKWAATGLSVAPMPKMDVAPAIAEAPVSLGCKIVSEKTLGSHTLFLATIESIVADASLLDDGGRLCLDRANLVAYARGEYYNITPRS
jgi:flavin reductase (DIM6/NTAB) family NADH-FMN oxidoreductase RutF